MKKGLLGLLGMLSVALTLASCTSVAVLVDNDAGSVDKSSEKDITTFLIGEQVGVINETDITAALPYGTDITNLTTIIIVSQRATVSPASGAAQDFTDPVIYTVTAADGTTQDYTVTVTVAPSDIATVTSAVYTVSAGGTASETITDVQFATGKVAFLAALTMGEDNQTWDSTGITNPVVTGNTLVVTAQDGTTVVTYTVTARTSYILRDRGPAGGWIFYVDPVDAKLLPPGITYLEAAPSDQSTGIQWNNGSYTATDTEGSDKFAVGKGQENTTAIIASQGAGSYAAQLCNDLVIGPYDDWFLPSNDELGLMYANLHTFGVGGFVNTPDPNSRYWCSNEGSTSTSYARFQSFADAAQNEEVKGSLYYVRAARAF